MMIEFTKNDNGPNLTRTLCSQFSVLVSIKNIDSEARLEIRPKIYFQKNLT